MEVRIKGYEFYFVTDDGKVYITVYGSKVELKQFEHKGYRRVALSQGNSRTIYPVHRLVAKAFIPNPKEKPFINHKDGNKRNNTVANLEWCTRAENQKHSREVLGNTGRGANNSNYGNRVSRFYPSPELRNRLIELGVPRYKHDIVSLGEMLPIGAKTYRRVSGTWIWNYTCEKTNLSGDEDSEADARCKMLIYLLENSLIELNKV